MGVPHLNALFCSQCPHGVEKKPLHAFSGWKVAVDTSIYMYRYKEQGVLLENMFNLVNMLKRHNIVPCFIFDGKPPEEKKAIIKARKKERETAENEYNQIANLVEANPDMDDDEKKQKITKMETLKQKMTRITSQDIQNVKTLLDGMGVIWVEARGEADLLCARLCNKKFVNACLSDDMDMFVYGCPVVWRHISILQESVVSYNLGVICDTLGMTKDELTEVCVASETDYSYGTERKTSLYATIKLMRRYKNSGSREGFYEWLDTNTDYVSDMYALYSQLAMFDTRYVYVDTKVFGRRGTLKFKQEDEEHVQTALSEENFYFPGRH